MPRGCCLAVVLLISLSAVAFADDADVPPPLVGAHKECDAAIQKAEKEFIRAQIAARQKYLDAATLALRNATKSGNLDLANAVNQQKTEAENNLAELKDALANGGLASLAPKAPSTVTVDAKQGWQPLVHLKKGQVVHLRAEGTWRTFPPDEFACDAEGNRAGNESNFYIRGALPGALIGRFGPNGTMFLLGKSARFQAPEEGDLQARINKRDDYLHDDSGALTVSIRHGDAGPPDKAEHRIR